MFNTSMVGKILYRYLEDFYKGVISEGIHKHLHSLPVILT